MKQGTKEQEKTAPPKQECQHDWQYNTTTHRFECAKCHDPAPPDWNEVPF